MPAYHAVAGRPQADSAFIARPIPNTNILLPRLLPRRHRIVIACICVCQRIELYTNIHMARLELGQVLALNIHHLQLVEWQGQIKCERCFNPRRHREAGGGGCIAFVCIVAAFHSHGPRGHAGQVSGVTPWVSPH